MPNGITKLFIFINGNRFSYIIPSANALYKWNKTAVLNPETVNTAKPINFLFIFTAKNLLNINTKKINAGDKTIKYINFEKLSAKITSLRIFQYYPNFFYCA